jgi:hypothetical protein
MAPLDKKLFSGSGDLDPGDYGKLEIRNLTSEIRSRLTEYGWNGEGAGCVCLCLSADNQRVERGVFATVGKLGEFKEEAAKIWPNGSNRAILTIKIPGADIFTFSDGGLTSDIVPHDRVDHSLYISQDNGGPTLMLEPEYEEFGIGGFCLRMICGISKNSSAKSGVLIRYTVMLFPMEKEKMVKKYDMAQHTAWPGLKLLDGEIPLLIKTTAAWGSPILPLILTGTSLEQLPQFPSGEELRGAISSIMSGAAAAETSRSASHLLARWKRLAGHPQELVAKKSALDWPNPQPRQQETGK